MGAVDIDMTKITGVKALNTTGSTGDIDVTNAASVMSLGFNGSTTNDIDVTYTADLSGTA